jgi:hypothetical protein
VGVFAKNIVTKVKLAVERSNLVIGRDIIGRY